MRVGVGFRRLRWWLGPLCVLALVGLALVVPAVAGASNVTVSLTATGPQPNAVTVVAGDSVTFVNNDTTSNHSVVFSASAIYSPVITPGQSWTLTVSNVGKLGYKQTGFSRHSFAGSIQVQASPTVPGTASVTLRSSRASVKFGSSVGLSGVAALDPSASLIVIQSQSGASKYKCSSSGKSSSTTTLPSGWTQVGDPVALGADGSFALSVKPTRGTVYVATSTDFKVCSQPLLVTVVPVVTIHAPAKSAKGGHRVVISGRINPAAAATTLTLNLFDAKSGRWKKLVTRSTSAAGIAKFTFTVGYGLNKLRVASAGRAGARSPFQPATSVTLTIRGTGTPPPTQKHKKK
jgi:plastocyanin